VNGRVNRAFRTRFTLVAVNHVWKVFEGLDDVSKLFLPCACFLMWEQPCVSGDEVPVTLPPRFGRQERGCPASVTQESRIG